jgi:hypothetical protein
MKTITAPQARLIAQTLEALDTLPFYADGQYLRVDLMDEEFEEPVGHFTNDEGTWLFETSDPVAPLPEPATLDEVALVVYRTNPEYYRDRKIAFIKDTRGAWSDATGSPSSLVDTKNACEKVISDLALAELRAKLIGGPDAPYYDEDAEWRAQARAREAQSERGTWFGAPGPLDEEPF